MEQEGWSGATHRRLLAALVVVAGDLDRGREALERSIGAVALEGRGADPQPVAVVRRALARLDRWPEHDARFRARRRPPAWDLALWERLLALGAADRRSLALQVVAGLTPAEADEVTGTRRVLAGPGWGGDGPALELVDAPLPLPADHAALARLPAAFEGEAADLPALVAAARAARTGRRRRTAAAVAVVVALVVAGVAVVGARDRTAAQAVPGATTVPAPIGGTTSAASLTIIPDRGLRDGQEVAVRLDGVPDLVQVTFLSCVSRPVGLADIAARCDPRASDEQRARQGVASTRLHRVLHLVGGEAVDCGGPGQACVLVAALSTVALGLPGSEPVGDGPATVLRFLDPAAPDQPTLLVRREGPLVDGDLVRVRGTRFAPEEPIHLAECASTEGGLRCDLARDIDVTADGEGRFSVPFRTYRDILDREWSACTALGTDRSPSDCLLVASGPTSGSASLRLTFVDSAARSGIRPRVEILTPRPLRLGQVVHLRGTGFQPGGDTRVGTCPAPVGDGPAGGGLVDCTYPGGDADRASIVVGADGTFDLPGFPLPSDPACAAQPGACVIGGHQAAPVDFTTDLVFQA